MPDRSWQIILVHDYTRSGASEVITLSAGMHGVLRLTYVATTVPVETVPVDAFNCVVGSLNAVLAGGLSHEIWPTAMLQLAEFRADTIVSDAPIPETESIPLLLLVHGPRPSESGVGDPGGYRYPSSTHRITWL